MNKALIMMLADKHGEAKLRSICLSLKSAGLLDNVYFGTVSFKSIAALFRV